MARTNSCGVCLFVAFSDSRRFTAEKQCSTLCNGVVMLDYLQPSDYARRTLGGDLVMPKTLQRSF